MTPPTLTETAEAIYRDRIGFCSRSEAQAMAELIAEGFSHGFITAFADGSRIVVGAHSREEARSKRIAADWEAKANGKFPLGSNEFSLLIYAPKPWETVENKPTRPVRTGGAAKVLEAA